MKQFNSKRIMMVLQKQEPTMKPEQKVNELIGAIVLAISAVLTWFVICLIG